MRAKDFIPASKPRNFVAKNSKTAGAGAHKDKKRAAKQGDVKHKQKQFEQGVAEDWKSKVAGAALAGAAALGGGGAQASEPVTPLAVMATVKMKLPDGSIKTIKKDLGHSYDYRLDDARTDLENLLDRKGIKNHSQKLSLDEQQIKQDLSVISDENHDPWQLCCGHDFISILAIALWKVLGTRNANDVKKEDWERELRLAYELSYFYQTQIYQLMVNWQSNNHPYQIF